MQPPSEQITALLSAVGEGDAQASDRLWRVVYEELHQVAKARMAHQRREGDLQTTVLVQEAYLRLVGPEADRIPVNRRHFFAAAANAMRQFLVDDARKRKAGKRGGGQSPVPLDQFADTIGTDPGEILAVDEALRVLSTRDARKAEIVQLRYFAGLTIEETAEVLNVSSRLVSTEWRFAKAWLHRELS